jgi:hypothetical protein
MIEKALRRLKSHRQMQSLPSQADSQSPQGDFAKQPQVAVGAVSTAKVFSETQLRRLKSHRQMQSLPSQAYSQSLQGDFAKQLQVAVGAVSTAKKHSGI